MVRLGIEEGHSWSYESGLTPEETGRHPSPYQSGTSDNPGPLATGVLVGVDYYLLSIGGSKEWETHSVKTRIKEDRGSQESLWFGVNG